MLKLNIRKKASLFLVTPLIVLGVAGAAYAAVTFGPSRPTFTWANPATYVTFNSITDNPNWGDERQLIKVRDANTASSNNATSANVSDNETVLLTVYFHNNADSGLNLSSTNTQVKFELPSGTDTTLTPKAYIMADNANPNQVWATADLKSDKPFNITYVPGSAKLYTNYVSGVSVSDSVVSNGALIGTSGTDGKVNGCAQYSGYVTIRATVHVPTTPTPQPPTPQPKPPTPAPKALPNTGPGEVVGLFAGASAFGTAAHMVVSRRNRR